MNKDSYSGQSSKGGSSKGGSSSNTTPEHSREERGINSSNSAENIKKSQVSPSLGIYLYFFIFYFMNC